MFELIILISMALVVMSKKITNKYVPIFGRLLQMVISIYCLSSGKLGLGANLLGFEETSSLIYIFTIALISFDLDINLKDIKIREILFLCSNALLLSDQISTILITIFLILLIYLTTRRAYLIDYISIFIFSLISLIYYAELSTTILTLKDSYYLYLTPTSEYLFFPLLIAFCFIEYMRLWGNLRRISTLLVVTPLFLIYKLKLANNIDTQVALFLLPLFLLPILGECCKLFKKKTISYAINILFQTSLMASFTYVLFAKYELAIVSSLVLLLILTIYSVMKKMVERNERIIITYFTLINLAAIPLSYSGLLFIDLISLSGNFVVTISLLVGALVSWIIFGFVIRKHSDELFINVLESTFEVKLTTGLAFILTILIIFFNLSLFVSSEKNGYKLMQVLFHTKEKVAEVGLLSYNLNFIIYILLFVVVGYFLKVIDERKAWRGAFVLNEAVKSVTPSRIEVINTLKISKEKDTLNKVNFSTEGQTSSFQISFYILILFLIVSLAIIEF
ncbi:hypothetical protein [Halobacteriovorax sp. JY17]|uniref:hypothetical protein n=1 Tax=Halobacteriovorax sp. JY17 TaxID=2014617 RepID=UPI000C59864A|nr:hypothetical protein [Halobacteriovorax sp. JY17]PIK14366.1 MAG: hypothetical protein CES88_08445 [Halobacteriovorax sp. JY17]